MNHRTIRIAALALLAGAAACGKSKDTAVKVDTVPVTRRTIVVDAQATGAVEPINIIEVKSKASGIITKMTVETGDVVQPNALLVQVDTRDVQNGYNQAAADVNASKAKLDVSSAQKKRSDEMFAARVITAQEHETAALDYANAKAAQVRAEANLDLAKQRMEDATVTAPVAGTIIEKTVSLGTVITSATGTFGGGTTLLKMANLDRVRVRALFNETDIGQVRGGQTATVIVDAFPDRRFTGAVEKIEPQAVVQQGVTMFPVLVTLDNRDGFLKPGMNGEVSVLVDERDNVLAVPNEALKSMREATVTATMLGLNPDSVQAQLKAQYSGGGGGGGGGGRRGGGQGGGGQGGAAGGRTQSSPGEVDLQPQQGGQQGGQGGQGFQMPDVSEKDCAAVTAAFAKKPAEKKKMDDMRAQMQAGTLDRTAAREQMQAIYKAVGVDQKIAGACRMKERQAQGGGQGGGQGGQSGGAAQGAGKPGAGNRGGNRGGATGTPGMAGGAQLQVGNAEQAPRVKIRPGLVFVAEGTTFKPRVVMLGQGNFDYTEVVSGLKEGEKVALLSALALQAARQAQNDRFRQNNGVPGLQQGGAAGGAQGGQQRGGGAAGGAGGGAARPPAGR